MSSVKNLNRFIVPNDVILALTKIYEQIGKNDYYRSVVSNDIDRVIEQTVARDAYFLAKLIEINISDSRMRLIIMKDSTPRTKEESVLYNIKDLLRTIQSKHQGMLTQSNDLVNMINYLVPNQNIKYDFVHPDKKSLLQSQNMKSKRIMIDELNEEVQMHIQKNTYEPILLNLHFYIDFININPFTTNNDLAAYVFLYLLLLKTHNYSFQFVSLFELIYNQKNEFHEELKTASYNWNEGYAQTLGFVRIMMDLIIKSYKKTEAIILVYENDISIKKANNIENTIYKLPEIFTKEDIRMIHPYVSESTINRALLKLRKEKRIKPLGKGRTAKWIKI
ncbi:MAG: hypothetical protein PHP41_02630 [Bacilli bacterium]|nr:hypothetical protein [Bacilli bacterium]